MKRFFLNKGSSIHIHGFILIEYNSMQNSLLKYVLIIYRYEMKKFNNKFGVLQTHIVTEFLEFFAGLEYVKNEVFDIDNCKTSFDTKLWPFPIYTAAEEQ